MNTELGLVLHTALHYLVCTPAQHERARSEITSTQYVQVQTENTIQYCMQDILPSNSTSQTTCSSEPRRLSWREQTQAQQAAKTQMLTHRVEPAFLVSALVGVAAKEIALGLDQVGGQAGAAVGVKVAQAGAEARHWHTIGNGHAHLEVVNRHAQSLALV